MRFSTKIVLGTWIIIALCFSIGGTYTIQKNFQVAYEDIIRKNQEQHVINRYALESNMRNALENAETFSEEMIKKYAERIVGYGQENTEFIILEINDNAESSVVYKTIKHIDGTMQEFIENGGTYKYEVYEEDGKHYMVMASVLDFYFEYQIKIVNRYDITGAFEERDRQIAEFIKLDMVVMAIALIFISVLAYFLTRNIKKLSVTSRKIAEGEYGIRINIKSRDEIGDLSRNFDVMAQSIEEHIHKLEKDVETREQFVSDFSHELKTPMTSMMGYSEMLMGDSLDTEKKEKAVNYIYSECDRLRKLSNSLLKMLGIVEENVERKWVYVNWLAEQAEDICREEMKKAELVVDVEDAMLHTEAELVVTLLRNIISNADRACDNKDVDKVAVTGRRDGESARYIFTVTDSGCGMDKDELEKITQPFYVVDKSRSRSQGGNGIGIAICNKICQFLDIEMNIESEIGVGTTVTLIFVKCKAGEENV